jgi:3,4-dihydroxy 2-butanone 4-phosphate synthase/GTP cyclohydrolase II
MSELFDPIDEVIAAIRDGKLVVVADDENRENEGDLIVAAEKVTGAGWSACR